MSRTVMKLLAVTLFAVILAWPMPALGYYGHESAPVATYGYEVLAAYIDPGVGGFIIVSVLGFISAAGYMARAYLARIKRAVFGRGQADEGRQCADGEEE